MTGDIYQLTFVATHRAGAPELSQADRLNRLFAQANRFETLGLTGILLHKGNRLLLCIEGPEAAAVAQYDLVKADPQVEGVAILRQRHVDTRSFRIWGFAIDDDPRDGMPLTLADRVVALVATAPPEIRQTFLAFAKLDTSIRSR